MRPKTKTPKMRTGCKQCKFVSRAQSCRACRTHELTRGDRRRKVKCDEGKPICRKCKSLGLPCHFPLDQPITFNTSMQTNAGTPTDLRIWMKPNDIISRFKDQTQWNMFFAFVSTGEQHGSLPINTLAALTPQVAHNDPAVREICCAVGAATIAFLRLNTDKNTDNQAYELSLLYCNRALRIVQAAASTPRAMQSVALVAMMLVTYDMLRGEMEAAYMHFEHGRRIMESYFAGRCKEQGASLANVTLDSYETAMLEMLQRLTTYPWTLELGINGAKIGHKVEKRCIGWHRYSLEDIPSSFLDLAQASNWWDIIQHHISYHLPNSDEAAEATWEQILSHFHGWHNSFAPLYWYVQRRQEKNPHQFISASILEARYLESLSNLHRQQRTGSNFLPEARPIYRSIIQAVRVMRDQAKASLDNAFVMDTLVMPPLTVVLLKCRDANVRQMVREILEETAEISELAVALLATMDEKRGSQAGGKIKNMERASGWYLTSCGCGPGVI